VSKIRDIYIQGRVNIAKNQSHVLVHLRCEGMTAMIMKWIRSNQWIRAPDCLCANSVALLSSSPTLTSSDTAKVRGPQMKKGNTIKYRKVCQIVSKKTKKKDHVPMPVLQKII
jgi:hypothetical protein